MPQTRYGVSPWTERATRAQRPSAARLRGERSADVVVVGGGFTGCLTAYILAQAGQGVVLLEASRIGRGATSAASGRLLSTPGVSFRALHERFGLRAARQAWDLLRLSSLDLQSLLRRLGIVCDQVQADRLQVALTSAQAATLEREYQALREAGFAATWLTRPRAKAATGLVSEGALKLPAGGLVDPYRACLGLARHAAERGAALFEGSPVRRIKAGSKRVEVVTAEGRVTAERVVVATGLPQPGFAGLARHLQAYDEFAVMLPPLPAALRRTLGHGSHVVCDMAGPPHNWHWTKGGQLVFTGATCKPTSPRLLDSVLVKRSAQLMYELSLLYHDISGMQPERGWAVRATTTADGLPMAGSHRSYPRHFFATGLDPAGLAASYLAARLALRAHLGAPEKGDELFAVVR